MCRLGALGVRLSLSSSLYAGPKEHDSLRSLNVGWKR